MIRANIDINGKTICTLCAVRKKPVGIPKEGTECEYDLFNIVYGETIFIGKVFHKYGDMDGLIAKMFDVNRR